MFNSLTGIITAKLPQTVYLDTGGIEWDISIPDSSINRLPYLGDEAKIYTWLLHRDDLMKVYGFSSISERALFLDLLKVEGVGPKGALKILSNISSDELAAVLDGGDLDKLEKLPGVGKKTAQKMMLALKGKLTLLDEQTGSIKQRHEEKSSPWNDVIVALVDMGYDRRVVETVVDTITARLINDNKTNQTIKNGSSNDKTNIYAEGKSHADIEEAVFRQAIVELAK